MEGDGDGQQQPVHEQLNTAGFEDNAVKIIFASLIACLGLVAQEPYPLHRQVEKLLLGAYSPMQIGSIIAYMTNLPPMEVWFAKVSHIPPPTPRHLIAYKTNSLSGEVVLWNGVDAWLKVPEIWYDAEGMPQPTANLWRTDWMVSMPEDTVTSHAPIPDPSGNSFAFPLYVLKTVVTTNFVPGYTLHLDLGPPATTNEQGYIVQPQWKYAVDLTQLIPPRVSLTTNYHIGYFDKDNKAVVVFITP